MKRFKFIIISIILSMLLYKFINLNLHSVCEIDKCPTPNLCSENIRLQSNSFVEFFSNYFGVKNIFYGLYNNNQKVVIKKLRRYLELNKLLKNDGDLYDKMSKSNANFKMCSAKLFARFFDLVVAENPAMESYWLSVLSINAEPLVLQVLKAEDNWPVPRYLGVCGHCFVETHCGNTLNSFKEANWYTRAKIALQLLKAAKSFTDRHSLFRFYLTDVSPDNIAIDRNLRVTFVDLENVIMTGKDSNLNVHLSERFDDIDGFAFSENSICSSSISDHNYYAICKLLLSNNAPWPMMEGGLLHSPPKDVRVHFHLFTLIRSCSHDVNCFHAIEEIIVMLQNLTNVKNVHK
ncbi:hypothetical protein RI129_005568 [Pyrocoelia pectoralis]|uniref:FAM69 protein-kinase domain-containing protein n=1 Tax=Pyrocoelia pectoralis TaxID=417401 RepID=A0AAN7VNP4_9COLE